MDRHDRCVGAGECGCEDRAHDRTTDAMAELGFGPDGLPAGAVDELPDDTLVGLTIAIELGVYRRLAETAHLQDRTVDTVIRRALVHTWDCRQGGCVHEVDPVARAV